MKIFWKTATAGSFGAAANWSPATIPGANDIADITAPGLSFYDVESDTSRTVLGIVTGPTADLVIANSTLTALQGTATGANRGQITIEGNGEVVLGGTIDNVGAIVLAAADGSPAQLEFISGARLKGGGFVGANRNAGNLISGAFTNVDNSIEGNVTIAAAVHNQKAGVILADFNDVLTLTGPVVNAGMLENNGTASRLEIVDTTITNTSTGVISSPSGGPVVIRDATIMGGTLKGSGLFEVENNATLDGRTALVPTNTPLTLAGHMIVTDGARLSLLGTINNTGLITVAGSDSQSALVADTVGTPTTVTLKGKGTVTLADIANSEITGAGFDAPVVTLVNVDNTIEGSGIIGVDGLKLNNGAAGVIDATGIDPLIIDTADRAITNAGRLQAESGSELVIASPLNNNAGTVQANDGALIIFESTATGGSAVIKGAGQIEFGATATTNVKFALGATGRLMLDDSMHYKGTVSGFGGNTTESIDLVDVGFSSATTKSFAGGVLTVDDHAGHAAHIRFAGSFTLASFRLQDDGHGGTLITDPLAVESAPSASLLGQHIAASLPAVGDVMSHAWMDVSHTADPSPLLSHPHT